MILFFKLSDRTLGINISEVLSFEMLNRGANSAIRIMYKNKNKEILTYDNPELVEKFQKILDSGMLSDYLNADNLVACYEDSKKLSEIELQENQASIKIQTFAKETRVKNLQTQIEEISSAGGVENYLITKDPRAALEQKPILNPEKDIFLS